MLANIDRPLAPHEVRKALVHVLASARFRACPRLTSFLRFVVEATLAGRGGRLKGYTIAVGAFGRAESFDPQIDPIVRVEAMRLRRALDHYYAGEGAADPVVIAMPLGHYIATFRYARPVTLIAVWARACSMLQRFLAGEGARLLPPAPTATLPRSIDVRQNRQAEGAPAARPRRPRAG